MRQPAKEFRGKRCDQMTIAELTEMREWTMSHGYHWTNRDEVGEELTAIDEHIALAKQREQ